MAATHLPIQLVNASVDYIDNRVDGKLHPAFSESGISYNSELDRYHATQDRLDDDLPLINTRTSFANEMQQYEEDAQPKFKTGISAQSNHTWAEVIAQVESARNAYRGVGKDGIRQSIRDGLRSFATAAPAMEAWIKLLPSESLYGSVLCGGFKLILGAAVRLGKIREDTYRVIDEIPYRIEKAETFMKTYRSITIRKQAADLYKAIIDALQHILGWYRVKAGFKFAGALFKGSAYGGILEAKMKQIKECTIRIDDQAGLKQHLRLEEVQHISQQTNTRLVNVERCTEQVKELAIEARNNLYILFRDAEVWQEAIKYWTISNQDKEARERKRAKAMLEQEGIDGKTRTVLLQLLAYDEEDLVRDMEVVLRKGTAFALADQDRAAKIMQYPLFEEWLTSKRSGLVLINGSSRRHENISPTSLVCAMLVHSFSRTAPVITLYWFCGLHTNDSDGNALGMMRSLTCQLLASYPKFHFSASASEYERGLDKQNLKELWDIFMKLVRQLPKTAAVVCIVDGISYYEDRSRCDDACASIRRMARLTNMDEPIFKVLITSPTRTRYVHEEHTITAQAILDIPQHVNGAKQGFDSRAIALHTEQNARKLSEGLLELED